MNERHSNKILVQHFDPISLGLVPTVTSIIIHASLHRSIDVNNSRRLIKVEPLRPLTILEASKSRDHTQQIHSTSSPQPHLKMEHELPKVDQRSKTPEPLTQTRGLEI